jgi:multiple sugar transport system ATP-binding protein
VFLFDEPLSNLDAKLRGDIKRLHQRLKTTIYVTHDQLADRVVPTRPIGLNRSPRARAQ